jgi:hypothetical protein
MDRVIANCGNNLIKDSLLGLVAEKQRLAVSCILSLSDSVLQPWCMSQRAFQRGVKPRILEITPDGKIAVDVPLQPDTNNAHMQTRMARKLPNGDYLVPHLLGFAVKQYDNKGNVKLTIKTDLAELGGRAQENWPFTAILLKSNNILVNLTHGNKTVEFDQAGKVVWRVDNNHVAGRFDDPCGAQRLGNGNTVICSYHQQAPDKPRAFEITRDKKVVWEFFSPNVSLHEIHVLTTNGKSVIASSRK